jgi:hypothetical protein
MAQQTLTVPNVGGDASSIAASVVTANNDATTLALACGASTDCGLFPQQTLVVGPSTYNVDMSDPDTDFTATQDCVLASSSAVCKETAGGSEANFPGSSTTTYEGTEIGSLTLTITAGTDKLVLTNSAAGSSSAAATQSVSNSALSASTTPTPESGSAAASSTASKTGSATAQASTAGATVNSVISGGGLFGIVMGMFGNLLL